MSWNSATILHGFFCQFSFAIKYVKLLPTSTSQSNSEVCFSPTSGFNIIICLAFDKLTRSRVLLCQAKPFLATILIFLGILIILLTRSITLSGSSLLTITKVFSSAKS